MRDLDKILDAIDAAPLSAVASIFAGCVARLAQDGKDAADAFKMATESRLSPGERDEAGAWLGDLLA